MNINININKLKCSDQEELVEAESWKISWRMQALTIDILTQINLISLSTRKYR